ncbi:MAG TPA: hypothetical protein PKD96_03965, partial [Candidatus Absconditabacterales bacterium]|nr:hypothetical protein [Candidatus Absconditabacterales bacterium]
MYLLLLLAYLFTLEAFAQVPTLLWEKGYGTTGFDYLMDFQAIPGGYIYCGNSGAANYDATVHHGLEDVWLIGADTAGNILWQKSFGGALTDGSYAIEKTTDGGYIVVGLSHSSNGDVDSICQGQSDVWILKTDSLGNLQWQKSYGGSYRDYLNDVKQTSDGGYVVVGTANSSDGDVVGSHGGGDCWLLKLSSTGVIQWQKSIGSDSDDDGIGIEKTSDGGYIVLGCSAANNGDISGNHGAHDYWIIKLDDLGNLQWEKSYGGSANDLARSFSKTSDGGYIITGYTESNDGDITTLNKGYSDIWIVKIDSLGVIQWQKSYGGSGYDDPTSISQTSDGGYIFSASSS